MMFSPSGNCCDCTTLVNFKATICCGCSPSTTYPVTVAVTQTSGGTFTGTYTITSSSGTGSKAIPSACGSGTPFTFNVVWSSPGFTSRTTTLTLPGTTLPLATVALSPDSDELCLPSVPCLEAWPATISATFFFESDSGCNGTYTMSLFSTNPASCTATYTCDSTCAIVVGGTPGAFHAVVNITAGCGGHGGASVSAAVDGTVIFSSFSIASGTAACPIAFHATSGSETVDVSE